MARKVINIISTVLLVILVAVVTFVFISRISGKSPSAFGYHIFRVSSGSMEPKLEIGDIILVKESEVTDLEVGDIVTYRGTQGDLADKMITHEIIVAPYEESGTYYLQTKGVAEGTTEDPVITFSQVEGKYVTTIKWLNNIYTFFLSPYGLISFVFVIVALFGYEMISLVLSYKSLDVKDDDYYEPKPKKKSKKRK